MQTAVSKTLGTYSMPATLLGAEDKKKNNEVSFMTFKVHNLVGRQHIYVIKNTKTLIKRFKKWHQGSLAF